jgi:hypothetical protein
MEFISIREGNKIMENKGKAQDNSESIQENNANIHKLKILINGMVPLY